VLEQLGMDPLGPHRTLIDQRLVEPHPFAPLQHRRRRDPRLGQIATLQQLAQQRRVGTIRLRPPLRPPRCLGVGRLGQMRLEARRRYLFDHVTPAGTPLHRQRHRLTVHPASDVAIQPSPEPFPIRPPHPTLPHLAGLDVQPIEGDLLSMQIQPEYHAHQGPPCSSNSM
jgi:hypothetical protein